MNEPPRNIWEAVWQVIKEPWFGWIVAAILLFLLLSHPRTITVTKTETKIETKVLTQWRTKISAGEGATTSTDASGHVTITGPVAITTEGSSASESHTASSASTTVKPAEHDWSVMAGALLPPPYLPPMPQWQAEVGRRILGPVWIEAIVQFGPGLPLVGAGLRMEL